MRRPRDWNKDVPPPAVVVPSPAEALIDEALAAYVRSHRFRRRSTAVLRPFGLSFPLWWALAVTERLVRENDDAVSQLDVGRRTELDKNTVSYLLRRLEQRGLVDRGPDEWYFAWRVIVTRKGERLLQEVQAALAEVARAGATTPCGRVEPIR